MTFRLVRTLLVPLALAACVQDQAVVTTSTGPGVNSELAPPDRAAVSSLYETDRSYYTGSERMQVYGACLEDEGFSVLVRANAVMSDVPEPQEAAFEAAQTLCSKEVDERFPEAPDPTPEVEYQYLVDLAECLRSEGYDIPSAPTFEAWRDAGPLGRWYPYAAFSLENVPQTEWDRLNDVCPQYGVVGWSLDSQNP